MKEFVDDLKFDTMREADSFKLANAAIRCEGYNKR